MKSDKGKKLEDCKGTPIQLLDRVCGVVTKGYLNMTLGTVVGMTTAGNLRLSNGTWCRPEWCMVIPKEVEDA